MLVALGIFGASLFYGDGMITPAISVLSAVEGIEVVEPSLDSLVVPVALVILTVLFAVQRFGTGAVGRLFGPVMAVWFTVLAVAGLHEVVKEPEILRAISPTYGVSSCSSTATSRSSRSAPSCSRSRAPRRSTRTWATSGARRSAAPGSPPSSRR